MGDTDGSATEPLFAPGAREAEQGGHHGVIADGEFVSEEHYSQRANWLRAGAQRLHVTLHESSQGAPVCCCAICCQAQSDVENPGCSVLADSCLYCCAHD